MNSRRSDFLCDLASELQEEFAELEEDFKEDHDIAFGDGGIYLQYFHSRTLIQWIYDIAKGMQYLASNHIMHGDLAARNILITGNDLRLY